MRWLTYPLRQYNDSGSQRLFFWWNMWFHVMFRNGAGKIFQHTNADRDREKVFCLSFGVCKNPVLYVFHNLKSAMSHRLKADLQTRVVSWAGLFVSGSGLRSTRCWAYFGLDIRICFVFSLFRCYKSVLVIKITSLHWMTSSFQHHAIIIAQLSWLRHNLSVMGIG